MGYNMDKMKVLITGGAGFIGSQLTNMLLADAGVEVVVYDYLRHYAKTGDYQKSLRLRQPLMHGITSQYNGDIRDRLYFREVLQIEKPDVIVHLAAIPVFNPREPYTADIFSINLIGSVTVFEEASKCDSVKRIVYASSSMAYGHFTSNPRDEEAILKPIDRYGSTKASGELLLRETLYDTGKEYIIIRPSSVYGPTDCNNRVIQKFVEAGINGDEAIYATEGESLDFTYVKDAAQGFYKAVHTDKANEIYNITAGIGRNVTDVATIVQSRFPNLKVILQDKPKDGYRPKRGTLDITKAKNMIGYMPRYTLEQGVNEYIDFVQKYK